MNEVLTHTDPPPPTDTIELFNPGTNDVNLGGWFLTDDLANPKKFQIPEGTIILAGGFVLFDENQFNFGGNGFSLGSDGDQVHLFSGTNGFITGYYHGFSFGAAQNGRTFGRHINSQGAEHFVAQATNTLGAANSVPLVGPIVISEIMYHPPESGSGGNLVDNKLDEFIELYNLSNTNVPLSHAFYPANTWKLSAAVDFSFPVNQSLAPNSFAVVVSFDPGNGATLAAFRSKYGLSANVPVYGPYLGKLDNSANSVRLSRPDAPNGPSVPYILVDRVDYADVAPWPPVADGIGASLQRLVLPGYGNDPTNWTAARPTPGSLAEGGAVPQIIQQPHDVTVVEGMTTNLSVQVSSPHATFVSMADEQQLCSQCHQRHAQLQRRYARSVGHLFRGGVQRRRLNLQHLGGCECLAAAGDRPAAGFAERPARNQFHPLRARLGGRAAFLSVAF